MQNAIYLDYNATAPVRPEAIAAMNAVLGTPGNASSVHGYGRAARKAVEDARVGVGRAVGVSAKQVIFNSGATEGNNTILKFYAGSRILIGATEHPSIIEPGKALNAELIPVRANGVIDVDAFEALCKTGNAPALVSIMLVNNETGVINPVADIAAIAHNYGAAVHVDAVQALGKIPLNFADTGADFMTISAHKCGGPQGIGALIIGDGETGACLPPPVLLIGGGQERSVRAGTENVAAIAGFGAAVAMLGTPAAHATHIEQILKTIRPDTIIFGADAPRVSNTVCFAVPGLEAQTLLMRLDLDGVAVSSGSACSSGKVRESHVLRAMGVDAALMRGAIRISTGWATTDAEIEQFSKIWQKVIQN